MSHTVLEVDDGLVSMTLDIEYSYYPGESSTRDDPGCPEEFEIISIKLGDIDVTDKVSIDDEELLAKLREWGNDDF